MESFCPPPGPALPELQEPYELYYVLFYVFFFLKYYFFTVF